MEKGWLLCKHKTDACCCCCLSAPQLREEQAPAPCHRCTKQPPIPSFPSPLQAVDLEGLTNLLTRAQQDEDAARLAVQEVVVARHKPVCHAE